MARKSRKETVITAEPVPSLYVHVALYIRLSVEDNKKRGCSVENQKLVLNDFLADKPDFVVYDTYIDNGMTGTNFHRPGFQQMLSDIEAGYINCVIVKDLSRLGRNSIDTGYYIEQYFYTHNVRFIAVTDQFDTADPGNLHGGIMLPLKNMINEAYSLDIGRKIKAQARQAMKDGDYIGARAPYGYRKDPFTGKRKFHGGIDLHARGEQVLAMMEGVVVKVGQDKTSGKYVTLRHGNYTEIGRASCRERV